MAEAISTKPACVGKCLRSATLLLYIGARAATIVGRAGYLW